MWWGPFNPLGTRRCAAAGCEGGTSVASDANAFWKAEIIKRVKVIYYDLKFYLQKLLKSLSKNAYLVAL